MKPSESKKNRDLQKVLDITRLMAATVQLDELLGHIIDRSMELLDAERASLFLYEPASQELVSRIAAGVEEIRFPADRGVASAAVQTGQTINIPDAYADSRFNPDIDRKTGFRTRNILSVPLRDYEDQLVGVLQVLNKRSGNFNEYDVNLAETLGAQAGVSLQRARLITHYIQKQEMERAMKMARDIQRGLLPGESPHICGFDVTGFCRPADDTGGDTYDFLPLPDGRWMLVVADASGHGIGPALVIAETRAMLRAISLQGRDVGIVLDGVNNLLTDDLADGRFVTCFLGLLDPLAASLTYAAAGHGPMLFYDRKQDNFTQVPASAMPLGIMTEVDYSEVAGHTFQPGDFTVVTTDGFFEAMNTASEEFGIERMMELLRRDRDLAAEKMIGNLLRAVAEFTAGEPQKDDLTAIVIRRK
ncbi:MAG: GAF domain-containing SpoIIE family protein phosphatase [Planctomycetota bacterium]|nr:GAF domain-containing SpoIIE family protein phosphatase [Planctomycetota bacterium]